MQWTPCAGAMRVQLLYVQLQQARRRGYLLLAPPDFLLLLLRHWLGCLPRLRRGLGRLLIGRGLGHGLGRRHDARTSATLCPQTASPGSRCLRSRNEQELARLTQKHRRTTLLRPVLGKEHIQTALTTRVSCMSKRRRVATLSLSGSSGSNCAAARQQRRRQWPYCRLVVAAAAVALLP